MSQEPRSSSEHQTRSSMICSSCREVIINHAYSVQRRRVRAVPEKTSPLYKSALKDAVDSSHGGVILGPEFDLYCDTCFAALPTIQELIGDHKSKTDKSGKNLD